MAKAKKTSAKKKVVKKTTKKKVETPKKKKIKIRNTAGIQYVPYVPRRIDRIPPPKKEKENGKNINKNRAVDSK